MNTLRSVRLVGMLLAGSCLNGAEVHDISASYEWRPVKIGGGGWVVGLNIHPGGSPILCRTDVAGGYRWNEAEKTWEDVVTVQSMPRGDRLVEHLSYPGVESLVSAPSDPNRVYMSIGTRGYGAVYASDDQGRTWTVRSDKDRDDTFYFYHAGLRRVFRSTDGGATWHLQSRDNPTPASPDGGPVQIRGCGGHLLLLGNSGLCRSVDGGAAWSRAAGVQEVYVAAAGTAAPGASYPAVYIQGRIGGEVGFYRSIDALGSWQKIATYPLGIFTRARCMDADKEVFGKVYVGLGAHGFAYGQARDQKN